MEGNHAVIEVLPCGVHSICWWALIYCSIITEVTVEDNDLVLDGMLGWSYNTRTFKVRYCRISPNS